MFFKTILNLFLPTKSWKNHPQKMLRKTQIHFFSLLPSAAQTTQTEEFMFQIVDRTGPRTILSVILWICWA